MISKFKKYSSLAFGARAKSKELQQRWDKIQFQFHLALEVDATFIRGSEIVVLGQSELLRYSEAGYTLTFLSPDGMESDGLSLPKIARLLAAPKGKGAIPSFWHDLMTNPKDADKVGLIFRDNGKHKQPLQPNSFDWVYKADIFYMCLRASGFGHAKAFTMHQSVCAHGIKSGYK